MNSVQIPNIPDYRDMTVYSTVCFLGAENKIFLSELFFSVYDVLVLDECRSSIKLNFSDLFFNFKRGAALL